MLKAHILFSSMRSFKIQTDPFLKVWLSYLSSYQKYRHAQSELMNVSLWADKPTLGGNHELLFYIEQLNSNYSSETDRNLQFPIKKTDLKCRAWLDQVQSAENSCFPSSWHIIIHGCEAERRSVCPSGSSSSVSTCSQDLHNWMFPFTVKPNPRIYAQQSGFLPLLASL